MSNNDSDSHGRKGVSNGTLDRLAAEAESMLPARKRQPMQDTTTGPKDITSLFTQHSSALQPGQLVKDEFFTLFESVGALEIMDAKMDSGFVPEGDSFDAEFNIEDTLDVKQVLWVMDQLMCLEIEWLEGYPLSQTVFTCLFVARLLEPGNPKARFEVEGDDSDRERLNDSLSHTLLRAYCVAVIKCLQLSMQVIQSQTYYEEEDFVTHLFGRDVLPHFAVEDALSLLRDADSALEMTKGMDEDIRIALGERLLFSESMLNALGGDLMSWEVMLATMEGVNTGHALATPTPEAFSYKVQRTLATSTPPRPMLSVSWDESMAKWRQLITDSIEAYRLASFDIISDPQCLQNAVWAFASRTPQPTTLPRAVLQEQLFHEQGPVGTNVGHYELFVADLRNNVLAGDSLIDSASFQVELPSDPRHLRARLLEGFMENSFDEYLNIYRMLCQNRCRIRRLFTQAAVILDALESEGARVDQAIANVPVIGKEKDTLQKQHRPLSSWVKLYKLRVMAWTIQMGFETEIYMRDELGSMYWYLSRITNDQSQLIQHIEHHLQDRMDTRPQSLSDCLSSAAHLKSSRNLAEVTQAMSSALSRFFFHLEALNIVTTPNREFSKPQLFYEARMKPYLGISNDRVPSVSDFEKAREAHVGQSTSEICQGIDAEIKRAKELLAELKKVSPEDGKFVGAETQHKKELKALETTCVAVAVNATQLGRLVEKHGQEYVSMKIECTSERRWHGWWVVPVLKERK